MDFCTNIQNFWPRRVPNGRSATCRVSRSARLVLSFPTWCAGTSERRPKPLDAVQRIEAIRQEITEELHLSPSELRPSDADPPSEAEIKRLRSRAMQYADADAIGGGGSR